MRAASSGQSFVMGLQATTRCSLVERHAGGSIGGRCYHALATRGAHRAHMFRSLADSVMGGGCPSTLSSTALLLARWGSPVRMHRETRLQSFILQEESSDGRLIPIMVSASLLVILRFARTVRGLR